MISISKAFGKTRLTLSQQGVYGSVGLGGGVRVGTDLVEFNKPKRSRKGSAQEVDVVENEQPILNKWAAYTIAILLLCVIPTVVGYIFLWTWLANLIAIVTIPAAIITGFYVAKDQ